MIEILLSYIPKPTQRARSESAARRGRLRDIGVRLLELALDPDSPSDRQMRKRLRRERGLGSKDRPLVLDTLFNIVRRRLTLERLLTLSNLPITPDFLWSGELVLSYGVTPEHDCEVDFSLFERPTKALSSWAEGVDQTSALSVLGSIPLWLASSLLDSMSPHEAARFAGESLGRAPFSIAVNNKKTNRSDLMQLLEGQGVEVEASKVSPSGIRVLSKANLVGFDAYKQGLFWVQDEGSQIVAEFATPRVSTNIIDFCAGAGGKSLSIAANMPKGCTIDAWDIRHRALHEAGRRTKRAGFDGVISTTEISTAGSLPKKVADWVLVDAPCSGTGTLRRHVLSRWRGDDNPLEVLVPLQLSILNRAAAIVSDKGTLVYATCSVLKAENDDVIMAFLEENSGWQLQGQTKTSPSDQGCDGLFAAKLIKVGVDR